MRWQETGRALEEHFSRAWPVMGWAEEDMSLDLFRATITMTVHEAALGRWEEVFLDGAYRTYHGVRHTYPPEYYPVLRYRTPGYNCPEEVQRMLSVSHIYPNHLALADDLSMTPRTIDGWNGTICQSTPIVAIIGPERSNPDLIQCWFFIFAKGTLHV